MPELPDIEAYFAALGPKILGARLEKIRLRSAFLLRSVNPPLSSAEDKEVREFRRLGKRILIGLEDELFLVFHLMIAGRFQWKAKSAVSRRSGGRRELAAFDFSTGTLVLTEAGNKKRASLYLVSGETELAHHDPGGLEVLSASLADFQEVLGRKNHTLKRALTDPRLFSGIGNAYSDEILHRARLSPFQRSQALEQDEVERLFAATQEVLDRWSRLLLAKNGNRFPEKVTAFHKGMAVHGRYAKPCPECGTSVQRILYAESEANYCARCQTSGRLLADRVLSRLLKKDWPRTLEELEDRVDAKKHRC